MIKILFICHGSILKSPEKACKINDFTKRKGTYYTTTTPVSLDVTKILRSRSSLGKTKRVSTILNILAGDYYIPDLKLPNEERPIGKYGQMHREHLKEHNPMRFNDLVLVGQLWTYLADLNEQAQDRLSLIVEQIKVAEGVTEELKATDQMAWIRAMNSIHNRAEEIVLEEIVYR